MVSVSLHAVSFTLSMCMYLPSDPKNVRCLVNNRSKVFRSIFKIFLVLNRTRPKLGFGTKTNEIP